MNWRNTNSTAARIAAWLAYGVLVLWPLLHSGTGTKGWIAEFAWLILLYLGLRFGTPFIRELRKMWGERKQDDDTHV